MQNSNRILKHLPEENLPQKKRKPTKHGTPSELRKLSEIRLSHKEAADSLSKMIGLSDPSCTPTLAQANFASTMRRHVSVVLGTQQPIITARTSFSTLTTTATPNLIQVVSMDVTGIAGWASFALLFDEYRVRSAKLHVQQAYSLYGAAATTLYAMPVICAIDYDDGTAIASLANAIQYDTSKIIYLGCSTPKLHTSKSALPEGQPDLAWVTTSAPTVPFWFKFWSISQLIPNNAAIGYCYISCEIEFRQLG
jgi:hypothetical protein